MNKNKNLAFTLAEVLIVIGIIGVVAALTLPNLNHATGDKEKVTKVKKIYAALTEAFDRATVIYGNADTWFNDLSTSAEKNERAAKRITEFMKVSKDCGFDEGCFASAPMYDINGNESFDNYLESLQDVNTYMLKLSDGMSLGFFMGGSVALKIKVDIDGPNKGKNKEGDDIFDFIIYVNDTYATSENAVLNQLYPAGCPRAVQNLIETSSSGFISSYFTAWVIQNDNVDYLKANSSSKCNNSDVILNWATNTSCH